MADETSSDSGARPDELPAAEGARPDARSTGEGARPDTGSSNDAETLRDTGKESLNRERNARREAERRATEAERRLAELEDAGKSEVERAIARLDRQSAELDASRSRVAELETKLAERELLELKREIALELGVPLEAAHRLQGTDARSIKADATRYLEERKTPAGDFGGGRGGTASGARGVDMNRIIREASGRQ
jgi:hypothetical protein